MFTKEQWKWIEEAKKELEDNRDPYAVVQWMWVSDTGVCTLDYVDYCHALLNSNPIYGESTLTGISAFQEPESGKGFTDEEKILFADWMINKSPYKECFLNPSAEDCLSGWVMNLHSPAKILVGACIATRTPSEFPNRFRIWLDLVNAGVDPSEAYVYCLFMSTNGKDEYYFTQGGCGHTSMSTYGGKRYYTKFLKGNYDKELPKWMGTFKYGFDSNSVWGDGNGEQVFHDLKAIDLEDTKLVNRNIFYKKKAKDKVFSKRQLKSLAQEMRKVVFE